MDRAYVDFVRLHRLDLFGAFFVTRAISNLSAVLRYSRAVDRGTGQICDQTIMLTGFYSKNGYTDTLRRLRFKTQEGKTLVFPTKNFKLPAITITELYRNWWQVELFFKWVKQHFRIKSFFGTSENAVKPQVWIAVSGCLLVAIVKKRLTLETSLYETPQYLKLTMFEITPIDQLRIFSPLEEIAVTSSKQLNLFES